MELDRIEAEIKQLETEIDRLKKTLESRSLEIKDEISFRIKNLEEEIEKLEKTKFSLISLFSFIRDKINLHSKRKLLHYLNINPQKEIDKKLEKENSELQNATNRYTYLKNNKIDEVNKRMKPLTENTENIGKIKNSPEYSGTIGELEVIKNLENLPDDYILLNDVFLELDNYIRFDNSYLKSAQIDHLVIGLTGVYVIEVKNWSTEYVQKVFSENSYTPYNQIKRSSYLTYKYLNSLKYGNILQQVYFNLAKNEIKVKSVIAVVGADIPYKKGQHTYVVRANKLSSYIQDESQIFSLEEVQEIVEKLIHRVNN